MSKLQLFHPLKTLQINQNFAEDRACCNPDGTGVITRTTPTCPVGMVSLYKGFLKMNGHNGLDLAATHGQPIYAACEGIVTGIQTDTHKGLGLVITTQNKYDVTDTTTGQTANCFVSVLYWHLLSFNVKVGDVVKVGDLIGWANNTGLSSGDHLHFEALAKNDDGTLVWANNGYGGAFDPLPYLQDISAQEKQGFLQRISYELADILGQIQNILQRK